MLWLGLFLIALRKGRDIKRKSILIDVRSPKEYLQSHIPFALNFPVLDDEQHQEIGSLYRDSAFLAKKRGSAYICQNIAQFLGDDLVFHPQNKLFLYCARGGQRSKSLWLILREIGFDCERMEGGYKAYRQRVLNALAVPTAHRFFTLYGMTGCGKSELIKKAQSWSIDLEGMSGHYGSSFGDQANGFRGQPRQAMFENLLFESLQNQTEVLLVEGESKKLGKIVIPDPFFGQIHSGTRILLKAAMQTRVERIVKLYSQIDEKNFFLCLEKIRPYMQKNFFEEVLLSWDKRDYEQIALILLEKYYDRVYCQKTYDFEVDSNDLDLAYQEICEFRDLGKFCLSSNKV